MRIAIDLTPLYGRKITGVEIYGIDLYKILRKTNHTIIPIFLCKNELDNNLDVYIIKQCNRLWLENVALPRAVRKIGADVTLFPIFPPPLTVYYGTKTKIIPTLHDCAFLKYRQTLNLGAKYYLTPKFLWAFKKADSIITISETIKKELRKYTSKPIYNCGNIIAPEYRNCMSKASLKYIEELGLVENKYFISVSTIEPRKNFKYLVKVLKPVLEHRGMKLVLVGRKGWGNDKELQQLIEEMGNLLVFPGFVEFEQLVSLYHYAYAFALLSLDEGFGRTPYEAVACGCKRVILSDIEIFHETFGENALFLPLKNEKQAQKMIEEDNLPIVDERMVVPFDVLEERINSLFLEEFKYV